MEVLGALASVLTIWLVTGILVYEAINRVINPVPVNGKREVLPAWPPSSHNNLPWVFSSDPMPSAHSHQLQKFATCRNPEWPLHLLHAWFGISRDQLCNAATVSPHSS